VHAIVGVSAARRGVSAVTSRVQEVEQGVMDSRCTTPQVPRSARLAVWGTRFGPLAEHPLLVSTCSAQDTSEFSSVQLLQTVLRLGQRASRAGECCYQSLVSGHRNRVRPNRPPIAIAAFDQVSPVCTFHGAVCRELTKPLAAVITISSCSCLQSAALCSPGAVTDASAASVPAISLTRIQ